MTWFEAAKERLKNWKTQEAAGQAASQEWLNQFTPRAQQVLALAAKEAKTLNHPYVGTEHILLGLLRQGDGVAGRVLKNLKVDIEQTRLEILRAGHAPRQRDCL